MIDIAVISCFFAAVIRSSAVILFILLLWPTVAKLSVLVSFYLEQERIAHELCEQRDVENSCCKGTCVLKRELAKTQDEQSERTPELRLKNEITYYLASELVIEPFHKSIALLHSGFYIECQGEYLPSRLFQPPCA